VRKRRPSAEAPPAVILVHQTQPTEGKSTPEDGLDRAIENAASDWWFQAALLAIQQLGQSGRGFTADHLLDMVGLPNEPHHVGAVFAAARRQRIAEAVGAAVAADGRLVRVWWGLPT
jgi:hypothetical protein